MLKVKTKYDVRQELCEALRAGKIDGVHRITNSYKYGNKYCVFGYAHYIILGRSSHEVKAITETETLGFTHKECYDIVNFSDGGYPGSVIADYIDMCP